MDAFPLPHELRTLLTNRAATLAAIQQHQDLLSRLSSIIAARSAGNAQMNLDVDLGMGYSIEGVVPDTSRVYVGLGLQDVWLEVELEKAEGFMKRKLELLDKKVAALDEPISKLKEEYALVTKTLRTALQLGDEDEGDEDAAAKSTP